MLRGDARSSDLLPNSKNQLLLLTAIHSKGIAVNKIRQKKTELARAK
ncbi:hypothetical protein [Dyadobacter sandarakinus]|uniref:Uncharacterized protein n=1 Tax=Dyadobacter sandarakinus TaxID=2747268 RepID=A0ABX7I427_9BACT|nr:hypothetical protein [Dyadobacter sandarakinus]QRR00841.1 hypothetical protein HWI92_07915 [Dyadobacter sandarakinus]